MVKVRTDSKANQHSANDSNFSAVEDFGSLGRSHLIVKVAVENGRLDPSRCKNEETELRNTSDFYGETIESERFDETINR